MNGLELSTLAGVCAAGLTVFLVHLARARDTYRTKGDTDGHRTH